MPTVPAMVSQQLSLLSTGASPPDVRDGQSFISPGSLAIQTGTMTDNGDLGTITPTTEDIEIPEGYTSGGTVAGDENLIASNIKIGTTIFEVTGTAVLAEGNATDADVLDGVTYSSASGSGTGSMPNNGDLGTITPATTDQSIPEGYTSGGVVAGDAALVSSNIKNGAEIFGVTGNVIQSTGTATADKLLLSQTASNAAGSITGTMPNNGALGTITPTTTNQSIPLGYTSGGTVAGSASLVAGNIRLGVNLFGVTGSLDPGTQTGGTAQPEQVIVGETFTNDTGQQTGTMVDNGAVTITPNDEDQAIPEGYHDGNGIVEAVTNLLAENIAAGQTVGGIAGSFSSDGTATSADIRSGVNAYVNGIEVNGSIITRDSGGAVTITPSGSIQTLNAGIYDHNITVNAYNPTFYTSSLSNVTVPNNATYSFTMPTNATKFVAGNGAVNGTTFVSSLRVNSSTEYRQPASTYFISISVAGTSMAFNNASAGSVSFSGNSLAI